ncbi:polyprenyl synthetase family protein [Streptomyces sp. NPDC059003]|uniref:polyprenyl synthetase family protein n=1 Tax=Streptomyces sp. NPDC059003 TaxID=3346691 RepID=UPI00367F6452
MTATSVPEAHAHRDVPGLCRRVDAVFDEFLEDKARTGADGHMPGEVIQVLRDFLIPGGKRLRPMLCVSGWQAGGGSDCPALVIRVAAALEMVHAFALIHDDVMDRSEIRRGRPTIHRALAVHHADLNCRGADQLGTSGAILVGDLALAWSDELVHTAGLPAERLAAVLSVVDAMRTEVMVGQYLDVTSTPDARAGPGPALTVIRYKTAKYTIERPLHIGALLAGADGSVLDALSGFALPLGDAFQLRDDLLGVFGNPVTTGKPNLDDLREGKCTVLVALALRYADADERDILCSLLGNPALTEDGAERIRSVLHRTGAHTMVEEMLRKRQSAAAHALDQAGFPAETTALLHQVAQRAVMRQS